MFFGNADSVPKTLVMGYVMFILTLIFLTAFALHLSKWAQVRKSIPYFIFEKALVPYVLLTWRLKYSAGPLVGHPLLVGVALAIVIWWILLSGSLVPQLLRVLTNAFGMDEDGADGDSQIVRDRMDIFSYDLMSLVIILMPVFFWHVRLVFDMI